VGDEIPIVPLPFALSGNDVVELIGGMGVIGVKRIRRQEKDAKPKIIGGNRAGWPDELHISQFAALAVTKAVINAAAPLKLIIESGYRIDQMSGVIGCQGACRGEVVGGGQVAVMRFLPRRR
jgi:hypothetical protein